jgi:hypothetical protein
MFEVLWDRNPDQVFHALEEDAELPAADSASVYRMQIASSLPQMFTCVRESD